MMGIVLRRRLISAVMVTLALAGTALALVWLGAILWALVLKGVSALSPAVFTQGTPPPGSQGGLANAIVGSLEMTAFSVVIAVPVGILTGTYLAELGHAGHLAKVVRFVNDTLLSAPSIVIGLFVFQIMVVPMGHFSGWAGTVALAIIAVPIIVRTTEDMLKLVPDSLREAAAALGAPRWRVTVQVCYRAAFQGLLTGGLLAVARVSGETAPLLFTALNNQFWGTMNTAMPSLPVVIYQFAMSPYQDWQRLAWGGAFLITVMVLALNIIARFIAHSRTKTA